MRGDPNAGQRTPTLRVLEASPEARLGVVEDALLHHLTTSEPDAAIACAVRALEHGRPVSEVSARLGLLPKRFVRRFRDRIGLTPKRFSRVRRLQRVLGEVAREDRVEWAEVAAEHGFYDQAHLVHDFRELTGLTPSAYRPRAAAEWNHVSVGSPGH